jgi:predicted ATPase
MSNLTQVTFENFRVFNTKTIFDLAPITFLTGPNSSGKSSVLKALLLLKSNYSSDLQVLDFSGPKHNLGTFENTLNTDSKEKNECLVIGLQTTIGSIENLGIPQGTFFRQSITTRRSSYSVLMEFDDSFKIPITIELTYERNDRSGRLKMLELFTKDDTASFLKLEIGTSDINSTHSLYIDSEKVNKDKILKSIFHDPIQIFVKTAEYLKKNKSKTYITPTIFAPKENAKEIYIDEPITIFSKIFEKYVFDNFDLKNRKEIHRFFLASPLKIILKTFSEITDNIEYLEAVRANTKRIYTNDSQGTSFNELILEYRSRDISEESLSFTNKWLKKLEIADELRFENIEGVATTIFLVKNGKKIALADLGYGITQFLPILLKIALEEPIRKKEEGHLVVVKKIILLEEPETNLHPKMQSMIAEFLLDTIKTFEVRFIVETHSEYIIRKLQVLTAERKIKQSDTLIYYFNDKIKKEQSRVVKIEIQSNGALTSEFGEGFFDEATNLKLELLKSKANS